MKKQRKTLSIKVFGFIFSIAVFHPLYAATSDSMSIGSINYDCEIYYIDQPENELYCEFIDTENFRNYGSATIQAGALEMFSSVRFQRNTPSSTLLCVRKQIFIAQTDTVCFTYTGWNFSGGGSFPDQDGDEIVDAYDNCPTASNITQFDSDDDGAGNSCDNCVVINNPDQLDIDNDDVGNACDSTEGNLPLNSSYKGINSNKQSEN